MSRTFEQQIAKKRKAKRAAVCEEEWKSIKNISIFYDYVAFMQINFRWEYNNSCISQNEIFLLFNSFLYLNWFLMKTSSLIVRWYISSEIFSARVSVPEMLRSERSNTRTFRDPHHIIHTWQETARSLSGRNRKQKRWWKMKNPLCSTLWDL